MNRTGISEGQPEGQLHPVIWDAHQLIKLPDAMINGDVQTIPSPYGSALKFDGEGEGLILAINPIAGWTKFTIEVVFRPDRGGLSEQRFLHMGQCHGERMLFETRIVQDEAWYLDTFLSSTAGSCTLMNKGFHHALGEWFHTALTFDGSRLTNYVNGQSELSEVIEFAPIQGGGTSIGMRQNKVSWYKGMIGTIRATPRCLDANEFLVLK
ncbi:MAG: LamG domain-containing protein [Fidelibacterota bacterium]|nr:MAG: LamG domain-containing protein [Candidatus Neomarinimicrobiota bacterium]